MQVSTAGIVGQRKNYCKKTQAPPPQGWLIRNMGASRIEDKDSTKIGLVYRDHKAKVFITGTEGQLSIVLFYWQRLQKLGMPCLQPFRKICPILLRAILKLLSRLIRMLLRSQPLYQILLNSKMCALISRNVRFVFVNIYANQLADKIARRTHPCTT